MWVQRVRGGGWEGRGGEVRKGQVRPGAHSSMPIPRCCSANTTSVWGWSGMAAARSRASTGDGGGEGQASMTAEEGGVLSARCVPAGRSAPRSQISLCRTAAATPHAPTLTVHAPERGIGAHQARARRRVLRERRGKWRGGGASGAQQGAMHLRWSRRRLSVLERCCTGTHGAALPAAEGLMEPQALCCK